MGIAYLLALASLAAARAASADALDFLVMGDWGGKGSGTCTTAEEVNTAKGMNAAAQSLGATFALALGDNFYSGGVKSVNDARFKETFEDVFTGPALSAQSGFRFHVVAGNHDHSGNVTAQIAYSAVDPRWVYPSLYYTFTETTHDKSASIQFVMMDTVFNSGNSQMPGTEEEDQQLHGDQMPGPEDEVLANEQVTWLETTLASSKADYLVVAGHYPIYSICEHGPDTGLMKKIQPLLRKYKVSAYLNGHDHCQEYINVGDGIQYHVVGSAHHGDTSTAHSGTLSKGQLKFHASSPGGFASVHVTKAGMQLTHYDPSGKELYTAPAQVPRNSAVFNV